MQMHQGAKHRLLFSHGRLGNLGLQAKSPLIARWGLAQVLMLAGMSAQPRLSASSYLTLYLIALLSSYQPIDHCVSGINQQLG